jgi:MFS family permease
VKKSNLAFYGLLLATELVWIAMVPLGPTFADEFSLSKLQLGALLASAGCATLVVSLPIGLLSDRAGARELTLWSALVVVLSCLGQGLAPDFWSLLAARAMFGAGMGGIWTAGLAWLLHASRPDRGSAFLGGTVAVAGIGFIVGPVFAGVMADQFGIGTPFFVLGGFTVLTSLFLVRYGGTDSLPVRESLAETLEKARRSRIVLGSIVLMLVVGFVNGSVNLLDPLGLRDNGLSAGTIGTILSGGSIAFVIFSVGVTRMGGRIVTLKAAGFAGGAYGLLMLFPAMSSTTAAIVAFVVLRAPAWAALTTLVFPLGGVGAQGAGIGRGAMMGLLNLAWGIAGTVGPLVAGAIAQTAGDRLAYVLLVAFCLAGTGWLLSSPALAES